MMRLENQRIARPDCSGSSTKVSLFLATLALPLMMMRQLISLSWDFSAKNASYFFGFSPAKIEVNREMTIESLWFDAYLVV